MINDKRKIEKSMSNIVDQDWRRKKHKYASSAVIGFTMYCWSIEYASVIVSRRNKNRNVCVVSLLIYYV